VVEWDAQHGPNSGACQGRRDQRKRAKRLSGTDKTEDSILTRASPKFPGFPRLFPYAIPYGFQA